MTESTPKSIRLYNFVTAKWALENVEKRRLKLSFPNKVNDLFELRPFDFGKGETGRTLRLSWEGRINDLSENTGFISFSSDWDVPTMWAHYAGNHSGVCLGFDVPLSRAAPISYVNQLRPLRQHVKTDPTYRDEMMDYAKRTKSVHWAYENEWRVWCDLKEGQVNEKCSEDIFYESFGKDLELKEIIVGHKSKLADDPKTLKDVNVDRLIKVRPSFRKFKMVEYRLWEYRQYKGKAQ